MESRMATIAITITSSVSEKPCWRVMVAQSTGGSRAAPVMRHIAPGSRRTVHAALSAVRRNHPTVTDRSLGRGSVSQRLGAATFARSQPLRAASAGAAIVMWRALPLRANVWLLATGGPKQMVPGVSPLAGDQPLSHLQQP